MSLDIVEDNSPEGNETFTILIDSVSRGYKTLPDSHVVTIKDYVKFYKISYFANTSSENEELLKTDTIEVKSDGKIEANVDSIMKKSIKDFDDDLNTGFTLTGWNIEKDGSGEELPDTSYELEDNIALYAQWEINEYTVNYDGNGNDVGDPPESVDYSYNSVVTVRGNSGELAKKGYTFSDWNTKEDGSGTSYQPDTSFTIGTSDVTLYAQWNVNRYPVVYFGNGNTGGPLASAFGNQIIHGFGYGNNIFPGAFFYRDIH